MRRFPRPNSDHAPRQPALCTNAPSAERNPRGSRTTSKAASRSRRASTPTLDGAAPCRISPKTIKDIRLPFNDGKARAVKHTRLPDLLFVGPPRTGTTWIDAYLRARGDVLLPSRVKETWFFSQFFDRGVDWYGAHFPPCDSPKRSAEVDPTSLLMMRHHIVSGASLGRT